MAPTIRENYIVGDDSVFGTYGARWPAQTFTVGATGHTITSVKLLMYRAGNPGTVTVRIRGVDGSNNPTNGPDLTTGTTNGNDFTDVSPGLWYEINLTEYTLSASTTYAIVVDAASGNSTNLIYWRFDSSGAGYTGGWYCYSLDSGATWNHSVGADFVFEVWGNDLGGGAPSHVREKIIGSGFYIENRS